MRKYLFKKIDKPFKACLHVHTTVSDGNYTPEEIKKLYMDKGFSIVAYTDHEIMVPQTHLTDKDFLALTAVEFSVNENYEGKNFDYPKTYHLNFYSPETDREYIPIFSERFVWREESRKLITDEMRKADYERYYDVERINDMIAKANAEGFLSTYNHPVWSLQTKDDYIGLKGLWGVEVYNHGGYVGGYLETAVPCDELLRQGVPVVPCCTDDSHFIDQCFGGWVMINAKSLTYEDVFEAMKNKDVYSSTGPDIDEIYIEDNHLYVKTSPVKSIFLTAERRFARFLNAHDGESLSEAKFEIGSYLENTKKYGSEEDKSYLRVTIVDENGKIAYSRAYFVNEILAK